MLVPLSLVLLVSVVMAGGFKAVITQDRFIVKAGLLDLRLVNIPMGKITGAESIDPAPPLKNWMSGWRYGLDGSVYFSAGGSKVLEVKTAKRSCMFVTDRAEIMAKLINDTRAKAGASKN